MRRVVYERRALRELQHEWHWYERRVPGTGERLLRLIESEVRLIQEAPDSFPRDASHPRARRAVLPKRTFPFAIIYFVMDDETIVIVALAHAKRRPGYWSRRVAEP